MLAFALYSPEFLTLLSFLKTIILICISIYICLYKRCFIANLNWILNDILWIILLWYWFVLLCMHFICIWLIGQYWPEVSIKYIYSNRIWCKIWLSTSDVGLASHPLRYLDKHCFKQGLVTLRHQSTKWTIADFVNHTTIGIHSIHLNET